MSTSDTRGPAGAPPPYLIPGLILLAAVIALAAGALVVDRHFRPAVGIEQRVAASPSPSTAGQPTAVSSAPAVTSAPAAASAAAVPSGVKVANSPLEQEVETAYLHYWDVRASGLLNLDSTHYSEVMAGAELGRNQQQVRDFQSKNDAVKIEVSHQIAFVKVAPDQAELVDEYTNNSYSVSPTTHQPIGTPGPGGLAKVSYQMKKLDGVWKVADGTRLQ